MVLLQILTLLLFSFFPGTPLFDSSANFTDPQTLQLLQHSQRLLANLSTIFHCLLNEAQELTQKGVGVCTDITLCSLWSWKSLEWLTYFWLLVGLIGLMNKCMVSSLISQYAQVVLWFCRTGLLPEGSGTVLVHSDSLKKQLHFNWLTQIINLSTEDDDVLQISRPFYSHSIINNYYVSQREELRRLAK